MSMTLEEMERDAFQKGETEKAELIRLAIDRQSGSLEEIDSLEQECESERERADSAEQALSDLSMTIGKQLEIIENEIEGSVDKEKISMAIEKIRGEL